MLPPVSGSVKVWPEMPNGISVVGFSHDGKKFLTGSAAQSGSGPLPAALHRRADGAPGAVKPGRLSPRRDDHSDGELGAATSASGAVAVRLWDITGLPLGGRHRARRLSRAIFSHDGQCILMIAGEIAVHPELSVQVMRAQTALTGSASRIRLWAEVLTGMELIESANTADSLTRMHGQSGAGSSPSKTSPKPMSGRVSLFSGAIHHSGPRDRACGRAYKYRSRTSRKLFRRRRLPIVCAINLCPPCRVRGRPFRSWRLRDVSLGFWRLRDVSLGFWFSIVISEKTLCVSRCPYWGVPGTGVPGTQGSGDIPNFGGVDDAWGRVS